MTTSPGHEAPPQMRVGDYTLLSRIGEGGMGVVHLARKPEGKRVALKVLRPHVVSDEEARARLAREVNSLSRVRSPRVAEIVDADPWGPVPFVATRYVPGLSLHQHVRQEGTLQGEDLLWFARGLAEALHAVHRVDVLHRDVKPSNVLLEGRNPVLIDFGLARVSDDENITRAGWLLGTPGYLAPEILQGHNPTSAADVHSWAATVAFAGTGRPPFGKGPSMAVMDRVRRGEHDLAGLDLAVAGLVANALAPDPGQRPRLNDVIETLGGDPTVERASTDAPTLALPVTPPATRPVSQSVSQPGPQPTDPTPFLQPMREPYQMPPPAPGQAPAQGQAPARGQVPRQSQPQPRQDGRQPYADPVPQPVRVPWTERIRRWVLGLVLLAAVTAALVLAPYVVGGGLVVLTTVLRCLSLSTSAAAERRRRHGAKWYDGLLSVVAVPWHFLVSLPATVMLLCWAALIGACVGLVLVAVKVDDLVVLGASGLLVALALWTGPGSSRLRSPVQRIGFPIARVAVPWLLVTLLLTATATGMLAWADVDGVFWQPADDAPWGPGTWLGRHL